MTKLYDGDTFEHKGNTFRVRIHADDSGDLPWEREDGHGPVTDWTRRDKTPGEMVLSSDRGAKRYYDFQEAMKIAKRDNWGLCDDDKAALLARLVKSGRDASKPLTRGEIIAEAVKSDFDRLRRFCDDQWSYVGVVVCLVDDHGDDDTTETASLWGIESDCYDYIAETAHELADEIADTLIIAN